jgi:hypothetical protein
MICPAGEAQRSVLAGRHIPPPGAATAQRRWHDDDWNTKPTGGLFRRT